MGDGSALKLDYGHVCTTLLTDLNLLTCTVKMGELYGM